MPRDARETYVDDRAAEGVFRLNPAIYSDAELFERELRMVFESTWNFLGFDFEIPKPHDFFTTVIGRNPILVCRDKDGKVGAFFNVCRHKAAAVCRSEAGNQKFHVCPYHGWVYDSAGNNVSVKDKEEGCYTPAFDADSHNLKPLARLASYKGLLFGSMSADVPSLDEYLGDLRFFIDLAMEQGENGMECIPGRAFFTYDANWKLQMDNGCDTYHLTSTHPSLMKVVDRRNAEKSGNLAARQFDWNKRLAQQGGLFLFPHGHCLNWMNQAQPENRPLYATLDKVKERVGPLKADWMIRLRNMTVFPNMQIADSTALTLRQFIPISVNKTEVRYYCLAPVGEPAATREWRLRQFEDFFNASGLATPDDTSCYQECQVGYAAPATEWLQGACRGMAGLVEGPNEMAREIGIHPAASLQGPYALQHEIGTQAQYREWARLMAAPDRV